MIDIVLSMIERTSVFVPPPAGKAGVYVLWDKPPSTFYVGARIRFIVGATNEEVLGCITAIEPPGSSIRPDTQQDKQKWKIHWVPFNPDETEAVLRTLGSGSCPACDAKRLRIVNTVKKGRNVIRRRRCLECGVAFSTAEFVTEVLQPKRKRHSKHFKQPTKRAVTKGAKKLQKAEAK